MYLTRTITALGTGLLLSLAAQTTNAQTTRTMPVRTATDTTCLNTPAGAGDSTSMQHMPMDSSKSNQQAGRKHCLDPMRTTMRSDSLCETTAGDSLAYSQADSVAMKADASAGRTHRPAMRTNCKVGLGAGVGTDSTLWRAKRDSTLPLKP